MHFADPLPVLDLTTSAMAGELNAQNTIPKTNITFFITTLL
jgi:hypothetical protein